MPEPITLTLPLPDHRLSINGRLHWRAKARLFQQHKSWAATAAGSAVPVCQRPYFKPGQTVLIDLAVERKKGGRVWDEGAVWEAMKAYLDGFEGILYENDKCVRFGAVTWDAKPTGRGVVVVTLRAIATAVSELKGF